MDKVHKIREEVVRLQNELIQEKKKGFGSDADDACILELQNVLTYIDSLQEEPVSEELEEVAELYTLDDSIKPWRELVKKAFKAGAKWQKQQDQSTIELAEDHACFAGRTKTIEEIEEKLLSEVLPCFMHGGEADEVVAKLDEVLNPKK